MKLGEIDAEYIRNANREGRTNVSVKSVALLIRAVRQLGARLDTVEDIALLDSEELERLEASHPIDPDVLELLEGEE